MKNNFLKHIFILRIRFANGNRVSDTIQSVEASKQQSAAGQIRVTARQHFRYYKGSESHTVVTSGELKTKDALSCRSVQESSTGERLADSYTL